MNIYYYIKEQFLKLKWATQRSSRGYADPDIWEFRQYLSTLLVNGLTELKETGTAVLGKPQNWDAILQDMIDGFELVNKKIMSHTRLTKKEIAKQNKAFRLFKTHFYKLMD